jgi:hypothetical protein
MNIICTVGTVGAYLYEYFDIIIWINILSSGYINVILSIIDNSLYDKFSVLINIKKKKKLSAQTFFG